MERAISIIVPLLNEEERIEEFFSSISSGLKKCDEVIFVDGGSDDGTIREASRFGKVFSSPKGRGSQMNTGAKKAEGDILLFLHVDCMLEKGSLESVRASDLLSHKAGTFRIRFNDRRFIFRIIETVNRILVSLFKSFYGDQGLFLSRETFMKVGGFPQIPFMEDALMVGKLQKEGRLLILKKRIFPSVRAWEKNGFYSTSAFYSTIAFLHILRVPWRYLYTIERLFRRIIKNPSPQQ